LGTLLDTSVLVSLEREIATIPPTDELAIASITASELLAGVHRADVRYRARREAFVEQILELIPTVPFSLSVARVHARLWADLEGSGRRKGAHDLIIAATALALGWSLATSDRRGFEDVPGLELRYLAP
jgi:tRNA(fMet)-specific endonuclease VapC